MNFIYGFLSGCGVSLAIYFLRGWLSGLLVSDLKRVEAKLNNPPPRVPPTV